jgi:hypothetical protein
MPARWIVLTPEELPLLCFSWQKELGLIMPSLLRRGIYGVSVTNPSSLL